MELNERAVRELIAESIRPTAEGIRSLQTTNEHLRQELRARGILSEEEIRQHTAAYLISGAELADCMVGPSIGKKGASKKQRLAREAARGVMAFGRRGLRERGWSL